MGAGWTVLPDCGCKVSGPAWVGTVNTVFEIYAPDLGALTETASATVRFEIDTSFTDDPAQYWKSVSGAIKWHTSAAGGKCTVNASGTLPIGLGSDENPMAMLRGEDGGAGATRFTVSIGPWPDQYEPRITFRCKDAPAIPGLLYAAQQWWGHPPAGILSADGQTLKGTYRMPLSTGTINWQWDLHREQ
jgi:hypothetical protein